MQEVIKIYISIKKSGFFAVFFWLLLIFQAAIITPASGEETSNQSIPAQLFDLAQKAALYQQPTWLALMHTANGRSNITDQTFLLSLPEFSPVRELQLTIDFLYSGSPTNVCRFPARYLWLRHNLPAPELPLDKCPDVLEFKTKVPLDEISLVFASERISQPASMLGHAFLKFSGKNYQGQDLSHAISFYTDADSINLPKLLFDSLVIGKQGYFSLSPYYENQKRYVDEELRNIWVYKLDLDPYQKELIRMHILELKQINLTYFFQKYNCATVLNFIIAVSGKDMPETGWWITPKDLIKNSQHAGLIANTEVVTPSSWFYRALADQIPSTEQSVIRGQIKQGLVVDNIDQSGSDSGYIRLQFSAAYNQYAYLDGKLNNKLWQTNEKIITENIKNYYPDKAISSGNRNNPIDSPGDSQITLTIKNEIRGNSLELTVLPVSHTLSDDNRSYASETSLQLFATTIKIPDNNGRPEIEKLVIFDMLSLIPYDEIVGGVSTHLHISDEPQLNNLLNPRRVFSTSAAIGLTKRPVNDIDFYTLFGGGIGYAQDRGYIYSTFEAGTIIREILDMKSILSLTRTDNQIDAGSHYYSISGTQSKFINKTKTLSINFKRDFNDNAQQITFAITLKNIF